LTQPFPNAAPTLEDPVEAREPASGGFASSLIAILGGQVACGAVALLTEVAYARLLGPPERGRISLCLMSIAFGSLVGGLGGEGTIVYWASRARNVSSSWLTAMMFWGTLGCFAACALWATFYSRFHLSVFRNIDSSSARLVLISIPAAVLFAYAMALASGIEQFRLRSACATARQAFGVLAFLLMLSVLGRSAQTALWSNFAGSLAAAVLAGAFMWRSVRSFSNLKGAVADALPTLTYGVRGQIGNLATFFTYRLDVFIVSYFLDLTQLGYYSLAVVITEALWQIPQAVGSALFPRTARTVQQDATIFTCFVLRQVLLITSVCGMLIAVASPVLVPLVFGARFAPAVRVIWWLVPGTISLSLAKVACADLAGRGKNGYSSVCAFACFALTGFLDWFLIPRMGILGAAIASSIAYTANTILILFALRYELRASWKSLFVPTRQDFRSYQQASHRIRDLVKAVRPSPLSAEAGASLKEGA
jgi:O-antigen/teichoic acid export membrane protein